MLAKRGNIQPFAVLLYTLLVTIFSIVLAAPSDNVPVKSVDKQNKPPIPVIAYPGNPESVDPKCNKFPISREYTRKLTAPIKRLFIAANEGDEETFNKLIINVTNLGQYAEDGHPILVRILWPSAKLITGNITTYRKMSPQNTLELRNAHAATLPAKTRMLASALKRGVNPNELGKESPHPPLHLALIFGNPEMVRLLLSHGANPKILGDGWETPINFSFYPQNFLLGSSFPELVTAKQRSEMLIHVLDAGVCRPYQFEQYLLEKEHKWNDTRPLADYRIWPYLAGQTEGSAVLEAMAKTGTKPFFDARSESENMSPFSIAAYRGNITAVKWLKKTVPQTVKTVYGRDPKVLVSKNSIIVALAWALSRKPENVEEKSKVDAVLDELLAEGLPWEQEIFIDNGNRDIHYPKDKMQAPQNGYTLMHYAAISGQVDWVEKLVKKGAPLNIPFKQSNDTKVSPLYLAVEQLDSRMVTKLLSLGANPLAGPTIAESPFYRVLSKSTPNSMGVYESLIGVERESEEEKLVNNQKRLACLQAILYKLSAQQRQYLDNSAMPPLAYAAERVYPYIDSEIVYTLYRDGFSLKSLTTNHLIQAIISRDKALAGFLLDQGVKATDKLSTKMDIGIYTRPILIVAIESRRFELLPKLLAAGADPNRPTEDGIYPVHLAISQGDLNSVKLLLAKGARLNYPPLLATANNPHSKHGTTKIIELAVPSGNAELLKLVTEDFKSKLDKECIEPSEMKRLVLGTDNSYWQLLISNGFGKAPECKRPMPMLERLFVSLVLEDPIPHVGWEGARLSRRVADLIKVDATNAAEKQRRLKELLISVQAKGRKDLALVLREAGVPEPQIVSQLNQSTTPTPLTTHENEVKMKLVGNYFLKGVREVGSQLSLRNNGTFSFMLAYGAYDEQAHGVWHIRDGFIILDSPIKKKADPLSIKELIPIPDSKDISVSVYFRRQSTSIPDLTVILLGDEPVKKTGKTGNEGWTTSWTGPLRHIIISDMKKSYVYDVPNDKVNKNGLHYKFDARPEEMPAGPFEHGQVKMRIDNNSLIMQHNGRVMQYSRE